MSVHFGTYATVERAKRHGEQVGRFDYPDADLHWREFSPITWGLMASQIYTGILVTQLDQREETA